MKFTTLILAAGKGTRMKSDLPKVLHPICGEPMIRFPLMAAKEAGSGEIVAVIGHGAERVKASLSDQGLSFVIQGEQLGTGHAVMACRGSVTNIELPIVILCGDAPLIRASTISGLVNSHIAEKNSVTVLTSDMENPAGYGRIVKDGVEILKIVEEKDASPEEKRIGEINSGIYCVDGRFLFEALEKVDRKNVQGEYYLTDIIKIGRDSGMRVGWSRISDSDEIMGINSRQELATANGIMQGRILGRLMEWGVTVHDPACTYVDVGIEVGRDSVIYPQVRLEGKSSVAEDCTIETGAVIRDSAIGKGSHIKPYCVITESTVGTETTVGPFAHLRPGTVLRKGARAGNFVEVKKSVIGEGSKVNHLTYIGDSEIGKGVNVGAGTITCNYDGQKKFKTVIEDGAFIGSGTNLVAPVTVGSDSTIGAGSTITKNVPSGALSLTRPEQKTVSGWTAKKRDNVKEKKK